MNIATFNTFIRIVQKVLLALTFFITTFFTPPIYAQTEYKSQLILEMNGDLRFYITQPNGERSGSWRLDSDLDAPNLIDTSLQPKYQALVLGNPEQGTYHIETDYRFPEIATGKLSITYMNPGDESYGFFEGRMVTVHDQHPKLSFEIDPTNTETSIILGQQFTRIPEVFVYPTNTNTTDIQWSETDNAVSYRIYKKQHNVDFDYSLIAETTDTTYETDITWGQTNLAPGVTSEYTQFVVSQIFADGTESFLSNPAYNNDSDQDGFDDQTEIELGTDPLLVDTDGDTLNDFYEVNVHNTDPLKQDTDDDGFDDNSEIDAGTSPLDPNFFPTDDCQNLETGNWYINNDCDLENDTTAPADVIIGNQSTLTLQEHVTLWFNGLRNKILVMVGSSINLKPGASIKSNQ